MNVVDAPTVCRCVKRIVSGKITEDGRSDRVIGGNQFREFYRADMMRNSTADQLKQYYETVALRNKMGLKGDGTDGSSFAAKLKQADEFLESGDTYGGATDSIGIVLRQMDDPKPGEPVSKTVFHNGVAVSVTKDSLYGNSITIGGSASPDWIHVNTSVGVVNIDLNDMGGLMKCLDMFSPEDVTAIMHEILKVKQARDALRELDETENEAVEQTEDEPEDEAVVQPEDESDDEQVGQVDEELLNLLFVQPEDKNEENSVADREKNVIETQTDLKR